MNMKHVLLAVTAALACAGGAQAAGIEINHAAVRVTIVPEARTDVAVSLYKSDPRLRVRISKLGDTVIVDGGLGLRGADCKTEGGRKGVSVFGVGFTPVDDLPQILVRTPMEVKVKAHGAVFGAVGRSARLELDNAGCGDWTVGDVTGPAVVRLAGSGDVRAGSVGSAEVRISGSGDATLGQIRNGLTSAIAGSGDLTAASVSGPVDVRVAGAGDVIAKGGQATVMKAAIAGSGDVRFGGSAQSLDARIAGSGDISVGKVSGAVSKRVAGSGEVRVGT